MRRSGLSFFFFCLLAYVGLSSVAKATEAGTARPPYRQLAATLASLSRAVPGGWITVSDYGISPGGRVLRAIALDHPAVKPKGPRPAVLITASTHGDEYLHIADRLPAWFFSQRLGDNGVARFFAAGGVILVVPVVNPDGYVAGSRHNGRDVDLNRDFAQRGASIDEVESRALTQWLASEIQAKDLELRLTLDYHCCSGALLFPKGYSDGLKAGEVKTLEQIGRLAQQDIDPAFKYGLSEQVLGYDPAGTAKDYFFTTYHALAITFEGRYGREASHFSEHTVWWDHVLDLLAKD